MYFEYFILSITGILNIGYFILSITGILNIGYFILLQEYSILDILFYYRDTQYWIFYSIAGILNIGYFILFQE